MLETIYATPFALNRHRAGPFLEERERYLQHCAEQGGAQRTQYQRAEKILWLAQRMRAGDRQGVDASRLRQLIQAEPAPGTSVANRVEINGRNWLKFLGWWRTPPNPVPFQDDLEHFVRWMRDERGLASSTVNQWREAATTFLRWYAQTGRDLSQLHPEDIDAYFTTYGAGRWGRVSISYMVGMLRSFLRHLASRRRCDANLAASIFGPRRYALENVPPALSWDEVRRVITATDTDAPQDIRDRAILMLMAVYGLRRSEVADLRLDQIHWQARELHILRHKRNQAQVYPLVETVATALARYVDAVRPVTVHPQVFMRMHAPHAPMLPPSFYWLVSARLRSIGLTGAKLGPHALRHACATRMLAEGLSLKEIGDHLGHRNPRSTLTYTKVDLGGLREVGDFDLGELQ
jgi:integrase/recombinase XerD